MSNTAQTKPWQTLGEDRDTLLDSLWYELSKEKPKIGPKHHAFALQRLDFDVLLWALKATPDGNCELRSDRKTILKSVGLESGRGVQQRLTYCLDRLSAGGFIIYSYPVTGGTYMFIPYLCRDVEIEIWSPHWRALRDLWEVYKLPNLGEMMAVSEELIRADSAARSAQRQAQIEAERVSFEARSVACFSGRQPQRRFTGFYAEYLLSEQWAETRQRILRRDGFRCSVCNASNGLNVHHRTYERIGCEADSDLVTLCRECHEIFHRSGKLCRS